MRVTWLRCVVLWGVAAVAHAGVYNVRVVPEHPVAGDVVAAVVTYRGCDFFRSDALREVRRAGRRIEVVVEASVGRSACELFPPEDRAFPIGTLPEGAYELEVLVGQAAPVPVSAVEFVVARARPAWTIGAVMSAIVAALAYLWTRRRRTR